eukprot:5756788-Amphidinium_carterae.1
MSLQLSGALEPKWLRTCCVISLRALVNGYHGHSSLTNSLTDQDERRRHKHDNAKVVIGWLPRLVEVDGFERQNEAPVYKTLFEVSILVHTDTRHWRVANVPETLEGG